MKLPSEVFGEVVVVHTPKEVHDDNADLLENFLTTLDQVKVVVDLDGTEAIDSEGLSMLLNVQETLQGREGQVKVCTTNFSNRKILEITRLDEHLEVYDSVIDAVKSFA